GQQRQARLCHQPGRVRQAGGPGARQGAPVTAVWPTAETNVVGVIGAPVNHSLSPVLHNAAFRAAGLDWVYVAFPVAAGHGADAVVALRTLGLRGLSVTMPHKQDAARAVDVLSPAADALGVINTVLWQGDVVVGDS